MKQITMYFDFISPYAYLAFTQLPHALMGHSVVVHYQPILFAALLKHHGQLGPAEIAPKRDWTYRQVAWSAHQLGVPLDLPERHPFNPLALLRLALACAPEGHTPNRYVCERLFAHAWQGGLAADDPERLQALQAQLQPRRDPGDEAVKAALKAATDAALAAGVFGVPSFVVDGRVFWGLDALPLLRAHLDGDDWLQAHWDDPARVAQGVRR